MQETTAGPFGLAESPFRLAESPFQLSESPLQNLNQCLPGGSAASARLEHKRGNLSAGASREGLKNFEMG